MVVNFPTMLDHANPDKYRLPLDSPLIPCKIPEARLVELPPRVLADLRVINSAAFIRRLGKSYLNCRTTPWPRNLV